jgi:YD repeat-containing protein
MHRAVAQRASLALNQTVRWLAVPLVCFVAVAGGNQAAWAQPANPLIPGGASLLENPLVVPSIQPLDEGEQAVDAGEARRATPEAFVARGLSQTAYEHLDAERAEKLARSAFPTLVQRPAGGPPTLPAGESIVKYASDRVAQLNMPGRKRGVLESLLPIALETSHGRHAPIDLRLRDVGHAFEPTFPAVAVEMPKRLSSGVQLPRLGISLTPVDPRGSALTGSQGAADGAGVIYANTLTSTDTLVKPTTMGFAVETLLRSQSSPRQLFFRVRMPSGATLAQPRHSKAVDIVNQGQVIARVSPPGAVDAEGTPVPVSMTISGDLLRLVVAPFAGLYRLPIAVDPEIVDVLFWSPNDPSGWYFQHGPPPEGNAFTAPANPTGTWTETISGNHTSKEYGGLFYTTRGASQIMRATVEGPWDDTGAYIQNYLYLFGPNPPGTGHIESSSPLPVKTEPRTERGEVCAPERSCPGTEARGAAENSNTAAYYQQSTAEVKGGAGWTNTLTSASVTIKQEQGPEVHFNTASSTIYNKDTKENIPNVLYGSGSWLGPHYGAFEVNAKDPGIGLSYYRVVGGGIVDYREYRLGFEGPQCFGVQCPTEVNQGYVYNSRFVSMAHDGEIKAETLVENATGQMAYVFPQIIKVDATPPYGIKLSGLQNGSELPLGESHLKIEATDGTSPWASSGIKSMTIKVDGRAVPGSSAYCSPGPCTSGADFALAARNYSSGKHSLVVTATDNAMNIAQEEFAFKVHGASPISVGPGSVDPSTGQVTLSASDVSLGGTGGVTRTYESRNLTAGAEGPLGPQWAINLGGDERLTVQLNGDAVLAASGGARTAFTRNAKGEFESPKGDSNLKLDSKEKEPGKGVTEYVLTNGTAGTKTKFDQPNGAQNTTPTFANQFGGEAGQLNHPVSDSVDQGGNAWVTDYVGNRIVKFSPTGTLVASYGSNGSTAGQFTNPWGVGIDPRNGNGNVYVTDQANNRVEELSSAGAFIKTFGWGVSDGKGEFEICTKECKAGLPGQGNGQVSSEAGVTIDNSGNVWVADYGNNRIQEFNEKGEWLQKVGSTGKEPGQFEGPLNIAVSAGNLYVTDYRNNRVQEFSTAGAYLAQFGGSGTGNGQFSNPYGIASDAMTGNLYVVDSGNARVQEFTAAGTFITKFGTAGTQPGQFVTPTGIAVNGTGSVYVVDYGANAGAEWGRFTWVPTEVGGPLSAGTTYAYKAVEQEGKTVIEPTEALAPVPLGVSCSPKLERGCRALTFNYAETTTATGESQGGWGDYRGHLTRVYLTAWEPAKNAMSEAITVAQYAYDTKGRLRAEWDPRIEASTACGKPCGALKTIYGYDAEGHVTSLTPPGQESWAFIYGTIPGDAAVGRLLKVARAPASSPLWEGSAPENTEAPQMTGSLVVGATLTVSNGKWSGNPVAYAYQWEDCNTEGKECVPIPGATNAKYSPQTSDLGHTVAAQVIATNGGGSTLAAVVGSEVKLETTEYTPPAGEPFNIASGPDGNLWFTNSGTAGKIGKITPDGTVTEYALLSAGGPYGITPGPDGNVWFTNPTEAKVGKITPSGAINEYRVTNGGERGITTGPDGNLWFVTSQGVIGKSTTTGTITESRIPGGAATAITAGPDGNLWFTVDSGKIGKATTAGAITEYPLPVTGQPSGITKGPDGNLWFTKLPGASATPRIGKITTSGAVTEFALPPGSKPAGITTGQDGSLWFTNNRANAPRESIGRITTAGAITEQALPANGSLAGASGGPDGNVWFAERGPSKIGKATIKPGAGESGTPQPGTTIEYAVPSSGNAAPYALGSKEVEAWGQQDDPVEGVAVIPPDEPMGWPATIYKRATIHYWDTEGRMVNSALPTGGIASTEYNTTSDVIRTLSADNRAAALKEGAKSREISELMDTRSVYSADGSQLLETRGPQHKVKLAGGPEVLARNHVKYYYDEGAPAGEAHHLLTKTMDGAEYEGKEADVRTTVTSYSGQNNLGWRLRKPTSVTSDPGGLNLTKTTAYDETTGNVTGATLPAGSATNPIPTFSFSFGSAGTGEGQFEAPSSVAVNQKTGNVYVSAYTTGRVEEFDPRGKFVAWIGSPGSGPGQMIKPEAIAIDATGNIWVGDSGNSRIDEFNEKGERVLEFGSKGTGDGQFGGAIAGIALNSTAVWVSDTANNRVEKFSTVGVFLSKFGSPGSGNGQFSGPSGMVILKTHLYITDYANHRVQEFTTGGTYLAQFGTPGTGNGQIENPFGIAADSNSSDLYVSDYSTGRVEEFTSAGAFVAWIGSSGSGNGQANKPQGIGTSDAGTLYVVDLGNVRVDAWAPGHAGAHTSQTIYYSVKGNAKYPACGKHPEWADLACQTQPAAQPETLSLPSLPVTTVTYNIWDIAETTTETLGSTVRIKKQTYDPAGRAVTGEAASAADAHLPKVTNAYNPKTGALETQSTTAGATTKTITIVYNTLSQMEKYTDADGITSTYKYDLAGRVEEVNYGAASGETASQIYAYDATTGLVAKLYDTMAGTFTASYDVEANITSDSYPNGMKATYARNQLGEATAVEYNKTTNCTINCTWFSDTIVPAIHGEVLKQVSTLSEEPSHTYDAAGRLTQVQEVPVGKGCATRLYGYDEEGNRMKLSKREPGPKGECAAEGGSTESHTYDAANRLNDTGVSYDAFGNMTTVPAADAGGHELKSSYYVDNQLATQEQEGKAISYFYDPAGRTREIVASGKQPAVSHYAGPGAALTWTTEGEKLTRNIPGIDGTLCATKTSGEPAALQLHDLQGNIVATAGISETETKLTSTYSSTEFGVPQPGSASPKYAWLGATGVSTELPTSGVVTTGASAYVPEIGRALQTQAVASPGAFPDGTGGVGVAQATYVAALTEQIRAIALEHEAALEAAARREAEEHAEPPCPASACGPFPEEAPPPTEGGAEVHISVLEGEGATTAGRGKPFGGVPVGPCQFKGTAEASSTTDFTLYDVQNRYHCTTNVNLVAWNYLGEVPGPVYNAKHVLNGFWPSEVWNQLAATNPQWQVGLCVQLSWTSNGRTKKAGGCFEFSDAGYGVA